MMKAMTPELQRLQPFLPVAEFGSLQYSLNGEEGAAINDLLAEQVRRIDGMPMSYQTDGKGDDAIAHLHYFLGGSDWFITEKDRDGDGRAQAFGFAILNGDLDCAEYGYIDIGELVENGAELDLYWQPKPMREAKAMRGL